MSEKCAYRYRIEEYVRNNQSVPYDWAECHDCSGYPIEHGCANYTTLDHLISFADFLFDTCEKANVQEAIRDEKYMYQMREINERSDYE